MTDGGTLRQIELQARILGAILDLASRVLSVLHSVELASKPRMADFARIVAAVDAVNGSDGLKHYLTKQVSMAADSLTGDPFILAVMELQHFEGKSAELLQRVSKRGSRVKRRHQERQRTSCSEAE